MSDEVKDEISVTSGPLRRGMTQQGFLDELDRKVSERMAIVEALAACDPLRFEESPSQMMRCGLCGMLVRNDGTAYEKEHPADCLWRRAVEVTR